MRQQTEWGDHARRRGTAIAHVCWAGGVRAPSEGCASSMKRHDGAVGREQHGYPPSAELPL